MVSEDKKVKAAGVPTMMKRQPPRKTIGKQTDQPLTMTL